MEVSGNRATGMGDAIGAIRTPSARRYDGRVRLRPRAATLVAKPFDLFRGPYWIGRLVRGLAVGVFEQRDGALVLGMVQQGFSNGIARKSGSVFPRGAVLVVTSFTMIQDRATLPGDGVRIAFSAEICRGLGRDSLMEGSRHAEPAFEFRMDEDEWIHVGACDVLCLVVLGNNILLNGGDNKS